MQNSSSQNTPVSGSGVIPDFGGVKKPSTLFNRSLLVLRCLLGLGLVLAGSLLGVRIMVELLDIVQNFQTHHLSAAMLHGLGSQELFSFSDAQISFVLGNGGALIIVFLCLLLLGQLCLKCVFNLIRYGVQLLEVRGQMNSETDPEKEMLLRTLYTQSSQLEKLVSRIPVRSYDGTNE